MALLLKLPVNAVFAPSVMSVVVVVIPERFAAVVLCSAVISRLPAPIRVFELAIAAVVTTLTPLASVAVPLPNVPVKVPSLLVSGKLIAAEMLPKLAASVLARAVTLTVPAPLIVFPLNTFAVDATVAEAPTDSVAVPSHVMSLCNVTVCELSESVTVPVALGSLALDVSDASAVSVISRASLFTSSKSTPSVS